jgi:hypothetical protein
MHGGLNVMDEQSKNQTSTDPGTVSPPPVEGRTDIGEGAVDSQQLPPDQAVNATTSTTDEMLSKLPAEGREDVGQGSSQEQSYTASTDQAPDPASTGTVGTASQAGQSSAAKPED